MECGLEGSDQLDAIGKAWNQGILEHERKYAQVQVQRAAQKPNQRTKREKPRKVKATKTRVSQTYPP